MGLTIVVANAVRRIPITVPTQLGLYRSIGSAVLLGRHDGLGSGHTRTCARFKVVL